MSHAWHQIWAGAAPNKVSELNGDALHYARRGVPWQNHPATPDRESNHKAGMEFLPLQATAVNGTMFPAATDAQTPPSVHTPSAPRHEPHTRAPCQQRELRRGAKRVTGP